MAKRTVQLLLVAALVLIASIGTYIATYEGEFMVEFGGADAREEFVDLLTQHGVSYKSETDHLGRVWIVPDQSKREEYDKVIAIHRKVQEEKVRKLNEQNRL